MEKLGNIIAKHRRNQKMTQSDLSKALKLEDITVSSRVISKWEQGLSEPSAYTFLHLCKVLGIKDIYQEFLGSNPFQTVSLLNEAGKEKALDYIQLLIASGKYMIPTEPTHTARIIKLFSLPASAGTGQFIDSDDYEEIEVSDDISNDVDFGIRISGNSMEPRFIDKQIVWVHRQCILQPDEIGIFFLNGDAYCKRLQQDENGVFLISLNKSYSPIPINDTDEFVIFGKVLS